MPTTPEKSRVILASNLQLQQIREQSLVAQVQLFHLPEINGNENLATLKAALKILKQS